MEELIAPSARGSTAEGKTREELAALAPAHLREELLRGWGIHLKPAAYPGVLAFGPNRGRNVTFVHPERWLGGRSTSVDPDEALRELFRRYLRAYGPATHQDFARWWGGDAAPARRQLLRSLERRGRGGRSRGAAGLGARRRRGADRSLDRAASVHLLPVFDVYTLHYRPREAFLPPGVYDRIYRTAGWISSVVLVDGAVAGVWEHKKRATPRSTCASSCSCGRRSACAPGSRARRSSLGEFLELPVELQL